MNKVPYTKQIQTFAAQISILKQRGMTFCNETDAEAWLKRVSYYRMSGYWYPLLADRENHIFKQGATFEQAVMLYEFDSHLRRVMSSYLERIEVAVRTQMAYVMSMAKGGHWFEDATLFSILCHKTLHNSSMRIRLSILALLDFRKIGKTSRCGSPSYGCLKLLNSTFS